MPKHARLPDNYEFRTPAITAAGKLKDLSLDFVADLHDDWLKYGKQVFPVLREKYPAAYVNIVAGMAKVIRVEVTDTGALDRVHSTEEIMDQLETQVGSEGRRLFERFMRQVERLRQKQLQEMQDAERGSGEEPADD
jgi:hypothetical protein